MAKNSEKEHKILLGKNIRRIRKRTNLTQDAFSERIGIEPSSLSNIENGKSFPSTITLIQIQEKFSISPNEIFNTEHLKDIKFIESDLISKIKLLDNDKKRILWKIIKAIEL